MPMLSSLSREQWQLRASEILLHEKIGAGQFGDVFKASLVRLVAAAGDGG